MKTTKKTLAFTFVLAALLCLLVLSVSAYDGTQYNNTGIYYEVSNGEVTITDAAYYIKTADIPESINGYPVTSIGDKAFCLCSELTSVTIPDSVTRIDDWAFSGCTGLTSITIPDSVTSIGKYAFDGCSGLTSVTIGNSVTIIGDYAFKGCTGLTSVTIPDSVTSIGGEAFYRCTSLTTVTIGNSVTSIGYETFSGCTGLTSITIPDSVTSIGNRAFDGCTGLTEINWNAKNVSNFSSYNNVFSNAGTAEDGIDVVFGDSVKRIPACLFFSYLKYGEDDKLPKIKTVTIGNSVTSIGDYAFRRCTGLTSITIPDSVMSIGYEAFKYCTGLTSITIPDSVTSIGEGAFDDTAWYNSQPYGDVYAGKVYYTYKGTMLSNTSITIKDGTKAIAGSAFEGCTGLTSITIPNSVTSIGSGAFSGCNGLTYVYISDLAAWCRIGFASYRSNPLGYAKNLYLNRNRITNLVIPDNVTDIGDYAFSGCSFLSSVTIPNSVTGIGDSAFSGCTGLTSITIPDGVTSIGKGAFEDDCNLTSITIPNSVTSIGESAFESCPLSTLKIGKGLKSIGKNAFKGIKVIPEIFYAGSEAEWKSISIDSSNDLILRATMYYNTDLSHTHSYTESVTQKATCTEGGVKTFTCDCGKTYTETIPATGHKYVTETHEATCTSIGVSIKKCELCGNIASATTTPAKGHTEVADKAVAATCTQSGKTAGSHCSVCGAVLVAQNDISATGHSTKTSALLTATETESGILVTSCETCGIITEASLINRIESVSLSKTSYTYNGKVQKPKVVIKNSKGKVLTEGKDYTVKYSKGMKNPGKYTVTVTFKGNYSGKKTLTFTIAPKAPTLKATAAKKSAKLSWNKQTGATGYNVYMATSKNGKYKKIATVKGNKVSYTKTGLAKGKTYYFKVAAYTTSGGKTINSAYSSVKSVKVK